MHYRERERLRQVERQTEREGGEHRRREIERDKVRGERETEGEKNRGTSQTSVSTVPIMTPTTETIVLCQCPSQA